MSKLLRSFTERITNGSNRDTDATKPRDDGFLTAKGMNALFTKTTPDVDGEECLHDCESCTINYPRKFSIDEDDKLYGEIKGWSRHVIVATGKSDWVRDVEDEKDSVMQAIGKHKDTINQGRLMLSASNIPVPDENSAEHDGPYGPDRPTRVLLLPSFTFIDNVTPNHVPDLISSVINQTSTNTTPLDSSSSSSSEEKETPSTIPSRPIPKLSTQSLPSGLTLTRCPHKYLILLCSQATRDARCGQSAPLLRRELERQLRPLGLYRDLHDERPGGVGIYFISHVGGHKYSANVLVYRRGEGRGRTVGEQIAGEGKEGGEEEEEAAQCIWLARIRPEDCENLVRFTVLQGKVVKPERQLRGGFDRGKGVVSW